MEAWITGHEALLWWSGVASLVMFVGSLIAVPIFVVRLPEDYFSHEHDPELRAFGANALMRGLWVVLKNVLGFIFLLIGILMLVLPGQGLLTMMAGLLLMDFPGKRRAVHWLLHRGSILRVMNWLRQRADKAPFSLGAESEGPGPSESRGPTSR